MSRISPARSPARPATSKVVLNQSVFAVIELLFAGVQTLVERLIPGEFVAEADIAASINIGKGGEDRYSAPRNSKIGKRLDS